MGVLGLSIEKGYYLGIDFGTTNSVVSIYSYDANEIITLKVDGQFIFPTAIQFIEDSDDDSKIASVFGQEAKESAIIYPESTVLNIKQYLGSDQLIKISVGTKVIQFKAEQIAGQIISYLKNQAEVYLRDELYINGEFTGCVITVPANSSDKQKKKTKEAAVLGGFTEENVYLRLEPAAAALSVIQNEPEKGVLCVYDFGGGTFDACLLSVDFDQDIHQPQLEILGTAGNNHLGGNDIDRIIEDIIYEAFINQTGGRIDLYDFMKADGISPKQKKVALLRLKQVSNRVKEQLSFSNSAKVVLAPFMVEPFIVNIHLEITQEMFLSHKRKYPLDERIELFELHRGKDVKQLIGETIECIQKAILLGNIKKEEIGQIILVGGSALIPEVKNQVNLFFGKNALSTKVSPALSISQGAARYCQLIMSPSLNGPKVNETTIHPIGLEILGRRFMEIIPSGIPIPEQGLTMESEEYLQTGFDDLTSMVISVYEDVSQSVIKGTKFVYEAGMNRLGATDLSGIPPAPKGQEKVKVLFHMNQDNILTVEAKSISTEGRETKLIVDTLYR